MSCTLSSADTSHGGTVLQDGDQYMVVWDKDLLQPSNSPPMDYTAQPPETVRLSIACLIDCQPSTMLVRTSERS